MLVKTERYTTQQWLRQGLMHDGDAILGFYRMECVYYLGMALSIVVSF